MGKETKWPNGIALDPQHRRLYWVDASKNSVSYIELNTKKIVTIYRKAAYPFGITIFEKYAYWTDQSRKVVRLNLSKKNQKAKVVSLVLITCSLQAPKIVYFDAYDKLQLQ